MSCLNKILLVCCVIMLSQSAFAQKINLDAMLQAGDLVLFNAMDDPNAWYYLPDKLELGTHEDGSPQFSFLKYVDNERSSSDGEDIKDADGGGVLHAVVKLEVNATLLAEAKGELKSLSKNGDAFIKGPVSFTEGSISIISAVVDPSGGHSQVVLGVGKAPLFEGGKAAFSILLNKKGANILWETFQTSTPDLSFSFEGQLQGYRAPANAYVKGEWDKIYDSKELGVSGTAGILAVDVNAAFEKMKQDGTIDIYTEGDDEMNTTIVQAAYDRLAQAIFEPISDRAAEVGQGAHRRADPFAAAEKYRGDRDQANSEYLEDQKALRSQRIEAAGDSSKLAALTGAGAEALKRKVTPYSLNASFSMKKIKQSGSFNLSLKKASFGQLYTRFDENIGPIASKCKDCFKRVNLADPMFRQREILVTVDGYNEEDFGNFINYVTVTLRKVHQDGSETIDDVRIDRKNFVDFNNRFKLMYGWSGDDDRIPWLNYDYRIEWNFFGDYTVTEDWQTANVNAIALSPALKISTVELEADPDLLSEANIRMISVKVYYDYGAGEKQVSSRIMPRKSEFNGAVEFLLVKDTYEYDYEVTWTTNDNQKLIQPRGKANDDFLFVDDVPTE